MMNIVMIPTNKIYSHPDNPRTDLGDLTELTASISSMGILQNLTVVPYDPTVHRGVNVIGDGSDCYIAVIGNRRLAAATRAKLPAVPAVISNMDFKEQNRVMLVENLQRETLSPFQQAKTIQLMLDLGDSIADVAKQTGFSEATIRNRVALNVFDADTMAKVEGRPATMKDYLDLAKLEDEALRNEVLESIGTADFRNNLARARSTLRSKKNRDAQISVMDSFAKKIQKDVPTTDMILVSTIYSSGADQIKVPADKDAVSYLYTDNGYNIQLWRKKTANDNAEENLRKQQKDAIRTNLDGIKEASERAAQLRKDFMQQVSATKVKKHLGDIVAAIGAQILTLSTLNYSKVLMQHDILRDIGGVSLDKNNVGDPTSLTGVAQKQGEWTLFALACAMLDSGSYVNEQWVNDIVGAWAGLHKANTGLDNLYKLLTSLGYQMSEEEKQLQNGTHPMFYVPQSKQKKSA